MKPKNENKLKDPMEFDTDPESNLRALNINMGKVLPQDFNPVESDYGDNINFNRNKDNRDQNKIFESDSQISFIDKILIKLGF